MKIKSRLLCILITIIVTLTALQSIVSAAGTQSGVPTLDISSQSFVNYTYGKTNFKNIWLYDFCDNMYTGIGNRTTEIAYQEMYRGIHAYVKDNKVCFKLYNNSTSSVTVNSLSLIADASKTSYRAITPDKYYVFNTTKCKNGLFKIEIKITINASKTSETHFMYFYANNSKIYLCSYTEADSATINAAIKRRKLTQSLITTSGITPQNSVDSSELCYPWHPDIGKNEVLQWQALSERIVKDEWSDSLKVFAFHEWMTKNLAYDYYKYNVIRLRRADYYNDYSGKHDTYTNKTGQCFDFTNILIIMCRHHGIPAVSIDSPGHTWNLVYLNGRWIEIDMTNDVRRGVYGYDTTKITNADKLYRYNGYGTLQVNDKTAQSINKWTWTYQKAKNRTY